MRKASCVRKFVGCAGRIRKNFLEFANFFWKVSNLTHKLVLVPQYDKLESTFFFNLFRSILKWTYKNF